jgi:phospholipid/cholesterol/gamma-HCH transport system substrate-binding protein
MISLGTKVKVAIFALVSVLGIAYVGFRYVGLGEKLTGGGARVHADFATAGGIFPNAPVTYRGVPVGRVDGVRLHGGGVRVDLHLDRGTQVPKDLHAVVAQRSAVGEQYLDLRPVSDGGPYLRDGDVIPVDRTGTPLPVETLLTNLDALVRSVGPDNLAVVIDELGKAFEGNETALRQLIDASDLLLNDANQALPETLGLIRDSQPVLATQIASADAIRSWAASLAKLTATFRDADADLRKLIAAGPPAASELIALLHDLDPTIGTLLGNLVTVNGIAVRRLPGIEQTLVVFPLVVAGGFTIAPGDGTAHLGLVVNANDPPACNYAQTGQRTCTPGERAHGSGVRSAANAPRPGGGADPSPAGGSSGSSSAQTDPTTGLVLAANGMPMQFGATGGQYQLTGDQSWKQLLLSGLAP